MEVIENISIVKNIMSSSDLTDITTDQLENCLNIIEELTGCVLYNKDYILSQIKNNITIQEARELLHKNLIPQISFEKLFKSVLEFSIFFKEDNVVIMYKDKIISISDLEYIRADLLTNELEHLPQINHLFVNNIISAIQKFLELKLSVKYHCSHIPEPYWKLFEIKCFKANSEAYTELNDCFDLSHIMSNKYYYYEAKKNLINDDTKNIDNKKMLIENDEHYRMEVMSYLNDNEMISFLENMENLDKLCDQSSDIFVINIKDIINQTQNRIMKFYYTFRLFDFMVNNKKYLSNNINLTGYLIDQINLSIEEIYVVQTAGLQLANGVITMINKLKEEIDEIQIKENPKYIKTWINTDQEKILHDINTNKNNYINQIDNNYNYNNNHNDDDSYQDDNNDDHHSVSDYDSD